MHIEPTLEPTPERVIKERASGLEGYCNYKVWRSDLDHNTRPIAYSITAKTSQEACQIYLDKTAPQEDCKVSVQNSLLPGGIVTFTVKCVPSVMYNLSLESPS